ncbi:hypothetical protein NEAUS04_1384 [Nematocida ausubeli]|nr:hypothetical protein NEAUS07_0150 [Nematocida ausubeli]KAI5146905.1 hypothetical protein NEAUS05_0243 [Nematocida ausubeli]KAI5163145.1 hypothetical protein NEAUS04_1384 [Nematocida ausubeli]
MIKAKRKGILAIFALYSGAVHAEHMNPAVSGGLQDSSLIQYEDGPGSTSPYDPASTLSQYDAHDKEVIPAWATSVEEIQDSEHKMCFNGVCSSANDASPESAHPPILRDDEDSAQPSGPPHGAPAPFDPERPSEGSIPVGQNPLLPPRLGKMPVSKDAASLMGVFNGPATGYGNGPTKDEALGVLFSIGDDDSYLLLSFLSIDLPLKNLVSNVTVTSSEVYAQDRKDYLMSTLEGKGSVYGLDNGLNILYTVNMFFYIPKTAIALSISIGKIIYSEEYVLFLKKLKLNTSVFTKLRDRDNKTVYYIPFYGGIVALPNPSIPIVSQILVTSEGFGVSLHSAKRIDMEKAILILSTSAYSEADSAEVANTVQKFTTGEIANPFTHTFNKYGFEEESQDSEESEELASFSSDSDSESNEPESSDSSSSRPSSSSSRERGHEDGDSSSDSPSKHSTSKPKKARQTIASLFKNARRLREKAALAGITHPHERKKYMKRAEKVEKKARALQEDEYNKNLIQEHSGRSGSGEASVEFKAAAKGSKSGVLIEGSISESSGSAWYSDSMKKNVAIEAIITSKSESSSASASASVSVFEQSSRKAASESFTQNGAAAIISAHQSNESHYKGVSSSEYATREIKHSLMGMTMQHALFSTHGRMYQSQKYSAYGVKSSRSSTKWLSRRISKIIRTRRIERRASRKFMKNGATSQGVATAAAREQAARSAAIKSSQKAAKAAQAASTYAAMAKRASAQNNKKMAQSYKKSASRSKKTFSKHSARAQKFAKAVGQFKAAKLAACAQQSAIFAMQIANPQQAITPQETINLNKAVAQILTSSQIQVLSKALSATQIRVLTSLLSPQQVQQTLVHMGAMSPESMQGLLIRLQIKGAELQRVPNMPGLSGMPNMGMGSMFPLGSPAVNSIMSRVQGNLPTTMNVTDIIRYLTQGQSMFQSQESLVSNEQMEALRMEAVQQTEMIKRLTMQIEASKSEIEARVRDRMFGDRMKSSISVCNPMLGLQTGMSTGAFDGISSSQGLQLAGNISLGNSSFNAIKQLLVSPSVSSYIGIDPNALSQMLYQKTQNNDLMCLLSKSAISAPLYSQMPNDEQALINARFGNTQNKLYGIYGDSLGRLEQALASAFNLIRNSTVRCKRNVQPSIPACSIQPQLSA